VLGKRIELAAIGTLVAGIIAYAVLGIALAGSRVAAAEHAVDQTVSHQNTLNATFGDINSQLTALGKKPSFDSAQALVLVDRSVANSRVAAKTVDQDDTALRDAEARLRAQPWLTMVRGSSVERASTRVGHAREAMAIARSMAADQISAGRFWQALYGALADLGTLGRQHDGADLAGAHSSVAQMKVHADQAAQLSTSRGMPPEMAALSADLQKLAADYGHELDAESAGNYDAASLIATDVATDKAKIGGYNVDRIGAEIDAYFKPSIDRYNAEIHAATE
jgi:hypothetical protein